MDSKDIKPIQKHHARDQWSFPIAVTSRPDLVSAEIVEKGLALQNIHGTEFAAEYLKSRAIGMDVAARVLTRPSARRKYW